MFADNGEVFGWGNSEYEQLSLSDATKDEMQINVARHLSLPGVGRVVKAASAGSACAVINGNEQAMALLFT